MNTTYFSSPENIYIDRNHDLWGYVHRLTTKELTVLMTSIFIRDRYTDSRKGHRKLYTSSVSFLTSLSCTKLDLCQRGRSDAFIFYSWRLVYQHRNVDQMSIGQSLGRYNYTIRKSISEVWTEDILRNVPWRHLAKRWKLTFLDLHTQTNILFTNSLLLPDSYFNMNCFLLLCFFL